MYGERSRQCQVFFFLFLFNKIMKNPCKLYAVHWESFATLLPPHSFLSLPPHLSFIFLSFIFPPHSSLIFFFFFFPPPSSFILLFFLFFHHSSFFSFSSLLPRHPTFSVFSSLLPFPKFLKYISEMYILKGSKKIAILNNV